MSVIYISLSFVFLSSRFIIALSALVQCIIVIGQSACSFQTNRKFEFMGMRLKKMESGKIQ